MEILKLLGVFCIMLFILLFMKKPIWIAGLVAVVAIAIVFLIPPLQSLQIIYKSIKSPATLQLVGVLYLINILQGIMQANGSIAKAEEAMLRLFNNKRVTIMASPVFMGLLPAPNAVLLSAPIVDSAAEQYLTQQDKAFLTSYYRHIPESTLPFYPGLLLAFSVSSIAPSGFILALTPLVAVAFLVPYFTTVRKVPKETGLPPSDNRVKDAGNLFMSLWPILTVIVAVVGFSLPTVYVLLGIVLVLLPLYRINFAQLKDIIKKALTLDMMLSMVILMFFRDFVEVTGAIETLPSLFEGLPLPPFVIFSLIMFFGMLIGLGNAVTASIIPLAFATIPNAGVPLLVLLMSFNHAALQLTPTHLCLNIAVSHFKVGFKDLVLKTLPVTCVYCVFSILYYMLLTAIM